MTKTYRILTMGNSFSEGAARYFHQQAAASGVEALVTRLFLQET